MKLAEAIALRTDLNTRMYQVKSVLLESTLVPDGERRSMIEDLLAEYRRLEQEHDELDARIQQTNWQVELIDHD